MFTQKFIARTAFALLITCILSIPSFAQNVGINSTGASPDASAGLDVTFTDKGVLIPRVALTAINAAGPISSPTTSLLVYNTASAGTFPNNVTPGFYYWDGNGWSRLMNNPSRKVALSADVPTTSATFVDVTGLSFPVLANKTYKFKFIIYYTASATSVGSRFSLNGPTFATNGLLYRASANNATIGTWSVQLQNAYNSGAALGSSYTTALNYCEIEGTIATTAAGNVIARFLTETASTTTITVKGTGALISYVEYEQLN
jgi:hypothetical protein